MNQVDISKETVSQDWRRIEIEYDLVPKPAEPAKEAPAQTNSANDDSYEPDLGRAPIPLTYEQKVNGAKTAINAGLSLAISGVLRTEIDQEHYEKVSQSYAELIVDYFPEFGLLGFMEKYKKELAAVWATVGIVSAVAQARSNKKLKELEAKAAFNKGEAANDDNAEVKEHAA
ncbi:hypothetical protein [Agarivorans sp. DSG3-1]|uniref:hypothetical protein n=1 Tax=Agarivorans sp. DSG3-1 TaxID=3342249 RepID=UPI00398F0359